MAPGDESEVDIGSKHAHRRECKELKIKTQETKKVQSATNDTRSKPTKKQSKYIEKKHDKSIIH